MRILYLREEGEIPSEPANEIPETVPEETNSYADNSSSVSPPIGQQPDNRILPPPNRDNYDYRIVPYYIPVGSNNYYRYRDNYLDYDRIVIKDLVGGDFNFTDGSYGILARYEDITIKAGSRPSYRKNIIEVRVGRDKFIKRVKNPDRARKIVAKLTNLLYNEGEDRFFIALIKYKFN